VSEEKLLSWELQRAFSGDSSNWSLDPTAPL
jgi:hypothetical protein